MPRTKKMKHFNHPHDLFIIEVRREHLNKICFGCKLALTDSCYACSICSNFFLHKSCAEVPQALQHTAHPKHTLGLLFPPLSSGTCSACGEACNTFSYNCALCNFNLHVNCAALFENETGSDSKQETLNERKSEVEFVSSQMQLLQQEEEKRLMQEMMEKEQINLQRQRMRMYQQQINRMEKSMKRMGQI